MPQTEVVFYRDSDGSIPVLDWLRQLVKKDRKATASCLAKIKRLASLGHELRRPNADYLRDGIYELRTNRGRVNYRILYFYHELNVAVVAHGLTKEKAVPSADIERAFARKQSYEQSPERHRAQFEIPNDPHDF